MKSPNAHQIIRITFVDHAEPGIPLVLDKEAIDKLGIIPRLWRSLEECYGSRLGEPTMWNGVIHIAILDDQELFKGDDSMASDLVLTAEEIQMNSQRQPPLPLVQAVTHPHCIGLLRALAQIYAKTKLVASLEVAGKAVELPHIALAAFTEPETPGNAKRHLRKEVAGVCKPTPDANIVLLVDKALLELPIATHPFDISKLYELVIKCDAVFVGAAELVGKDVYRALLGGELLAQAPF